MGVASHLGIKLREYDSRIRTFIPHYEEILDAAAAALRTMRRRNPTVVDLGIGSGALSARSLGVLRAARIVGIDTDAGMLRLAERRLGRRLTTRHEDFLASPLPRCDAVTASFALHHIARPATKARLYRRSFEALKAGGLFVNADCCLASNQRQQMLDRAAWLAHLRRRYGAPGAASYLRAWAREDVYFRLEDEIALLRSAGFLVDVPWRRDSFAVVVGTKR
jgi:trans-aconitate methyltransferase